jgi:hypothetical protein
MHLDFSRIVDDLAGQKAFTRIINELRPGDEYIFAKLLPEVRSTEYFVEANYMTVRSLMAGLVGTDSVYPKTGWAETSGHVMRTLKVANSVDLTESAQRVLQQLAMQNSLNGPEEVLNFYNKVIVQPHLDTAEWLRGQALANLTVGSGGDPVTTIDWAFNRSKVNVIYKRPDNWDPPERTGDDAYDGVNSKFWDDVMYGYKKLHYSVSTVIMNAAMVDKIIANPANHIVIDSMSADGRTFTLRKTTDDGLQYVLDGRYQITITVYDGSAEVFDPTSDGLKQLQYMPDGMMLFVGNYVSNKIYTVGQGSSDIIEGTRLGYTHVAPTVEGGGVPGRWGRTFTPENAPWHLTAEGVANLIPIIEEPKLLVIARG